jgi:hypothetical protein
MVIVIGVVIGITPFFVIADAYQATKFGTVFAKMRFCS